MEMNIERSVSLSPGKSRSLLGKRCVIVTHRFVTSPGDDIFPYMVERSASVMYVMHSFADRKDRRSFCLLHENGFAEGMEQTEDYARLPESLVLIKNSIYNLYWVLRSKRKWDVYIGLDGLSSFAGLVLRGLGRVRKVVYWSTDFVPTSRFNSELMNVIYREVNKFSLRKCDYAWNLSPRMSEGRAKLLGWASKELAKQIVVPMGVWSARRGLTPLEKIDRHKLVFLGHLLEKQGLQLILKAIPKIVEKIPDFQLLVIGTGPYARTLKQMVDDLNVGRHVTFTGLIESHRQIDELLSQCAVAAAPYDASKDTWTYWADPGKLKNYFAASLPVILTPVSYNAKDIERHHCGVIINYDEGEFVQAVLRLMLDTKLLQKYRRSAYEYSKSFDWENIFDNAFGSVFKN